MDDLVETSLFAGGTGRTSVKHRHEVPDCCQMNYETTNWFVHGTSGHLGFPESMSTSSASATSRSQIDSPAMAVRASEGNEPAFYRWAHHGNFRCLIRWSRRTPLTAGVPGIMVLVHYNILSARYVPGRGIFSLFFCPAGGGPVPPSGRNRPAPPGPV